MRTSLYLVLVLSATVSCGTQSQAPCSEDFLGAKTLAAIESTIKSLRGSGDGSIQYGIWLGDKDNTQTYAVDSKIVIPAASSIKVALLIEFFAEHADRLDDPFPATRQILSNTESPAIRHFDVDVQQSIRTDLQELTVRQIGEAMISKRHVSSNASYNAASNIVIFSLGGPAAATQKIRARHGAVKYLEARRYMLAERKVSGDNVTSLSDLAVILRSLASRNVPGLSVATINAIRNVVEIESGDNWQHFYKGGTLSSDPQVRIEAGWLQSNSDRTLTYAIAASRKRPATNREADLEVLRVDVATLSQIAISAWSCGENQGPR